MVKNPLRILCIIIMSAVLIAPSLTFERNAYAADNGCGVMITVEESTKELMNNGQSHIEMSFSRDNTINDILTNLKRWQMDGYYASNFETTDMVLMEGDTILDNSKKLS